MVGLNPYVLGIWGGEHVSAKQQKWLWISSIVGLSPYVLGVCVAEHVSAK
jgi:hypothetical protein